VICTHYSYGQHQIKVGQSVKLGTRSVLLGGANVHDGKLYPADSTTFFSSIYSTISIPITFMTKGSEVAPKALVDYCSSTTKTNQYLVGSPAKIEPKEALSSKPCARQRSCFYKACQIFFSLTFPIILSVCLYIGALPVKPLGDKFGIIGIMLYMISLFTYICGFAFLVMFLLLNKVLLPCGLQEDFIYKSQWFHLRKWYLDRWYLSPMYAFSLQRSLETTSSYPLYLRMLGANIGSKAWLTYCSMRVGMELISVEVSFKRNIQLLLDEVLSLDLTTCSFLFLFSTTKSSLEFTQVCKHISQQLDHLKRVSASILLALEKTLHADREASS